MQNPSQSRLGIASTVIGLSTLAVGVLMFAASFIPEDGTYLEQHFDHAFFLFALAIGPVLHLTGLVFGVVALFKPAKKAFAIAGVILNTVPLLLAIVAWILVIALGLLVLSAGGLWH